VIQWFAGSNSISCALVLLDPLPSVSLSCPAKRKHVLGCEGTSLYKLIVSESVTCHTCIRRIYMYNTRRGIKCNDSIWLVKKIVYQFSISYQLRSAMEFFFLLLIHQLKYRYFFKKKYLAQIDFFFFTQKNWARSIC